MTTVEIGDHSSRYFTIDSPAASRKQIQIHALIYEAPSDTSASTSSSGKDTFARPTIIALHYWGGSSTTFHHVPALLHKSQALRGHASSTHFSTVISVSHRGWGVSTPASPDTAAGYSINALASDLVAILPQFFDTGLISPSGFVLCGHSMGAKVAMAVGGLLGSLPQNFPPLRGMLLLAPAPPTPLVLPPEMKEQQIHAYESRESVEWTAREVLTGSSGTRLLGGKDDFTMIVQDSVCGCEGAKKGWPEVGIAENVSFGLRWGLNTAEKMKLRVLVSRGDRVETVERVERETVHPFRAKGFDVNFRVIEPEKDEAGEHVVFGHLLPLEAPEIVAEELLGLLDDIDESGALV